jgi:hemerythrin
MVPSWDDKYSIGNSDIDLQHQKLFDLAKKSFIYANKNVSREEIRGIVAEFFEYMKEHFKDEQEYMELIGYPHLHEHTMIHKDIIASMAGLIKTAKNVNDLKENLLLIAEKWLVEHILKEDAKVEKWRQANLEHAENELIEEQPKQYKYTCGCSHKIHLVPPHIHEKIVEGKKFSCMTCKVVIKIKLS